jgi:hypothetical protein
MKRILIAVLLLLSVSIVALGQEELPNDPLVNPDANACYEGGTLEGRCLAEIDWQAGWYLIRYEADMITYAQIPVWARYAANVSGLQCIQDWDYDGTEYSVYAVDGFITVDAMWFLGYGCTQIDEPYGYAMAYTQNGPAEATAICQAKGFATAVSSLSYGYSNSNIYYCE